MTEKQIEYGIESLNLEFGKETVNNAVKAVEEFRVEVPSWIFGKFGGGRFGEFTPPGYARNILEKLDDAAFVNNLTDAVEGISTHILWDYSDDGVSGKFEIAQFVNTEAQKRGLKLGSVNPTYFLEGSHRGTLSAEEKSIRDKFISQTILCAEIAKEFANGIVALWLPDGSNYPGQVELRKAFENTRQSLKTISQSVDKNVKFLVEYKVFEPGTYSTVLSDWGSAFLLAKEFGSNSGVLIDIGHHHHSTNIEQIVTNLLNEGINGGIHFNTRYAADDDHAVEPNPQIARIFYELFVGGGFSKKNKWALMIDQCSSRENRMHAILHSIDSLQISLAKAVLVNQDVIVNYQKADEIILANRIFNDAIMNADVRPIVGKARLNKHLPLDPVIAYYKSNYQKNIEKERAEKFVINSVQLNNG
jgi:L-rhamnose isomerase / sugar isomerase